MELRLTIVVAQHGHDELHGERLLDAFQDLHPEVGAVVSQNLRAGTLSTTFRIDAADAFAAATLAGAVFAEAADRAQLTPSEVLDVRVSAVGAEQDDRELLPA